MRISEYNAFLVQSLFFVTQGGRKKSKTEKVVNRTQQQKGKQVAKNKLLDLVTTNIGTYRMFQKKCQGTREILVN